MILAFKLSMPNSPSWNGKWSGEGNLYVKVVTFRTKKAIAKAEKILATKSYYYSWSDGWGAAIDVREVEPSEARKLRKASKGFCGYDWMVETIIAYGKPMNTLEVKEHLQKEHHEQA